MWIPKSEGEILAAIEARDLVETATFDAKEALPKQGKAKDLARDVAAMANDGGVLLYGVGEDEQGRPTVPKPFELSGARERVDQIVRTSISEPPDVQVREIQRDVEAGLGYLVVAVSPSSRAPHMVTVDKDHRFYGRSDTGNVRLTEGEVARLYERRSRWEVDRKKLLHETMSKAPIEPHSEFAYLHLVARPTVPDENLLDAAREGQHSVQFLNGLISSARSTEVFQSEHLFPDFPENIIFGLRADGLVMHQGLEEDWERYEDRRFVLKLVVGLDGSGYLFCASAAQERNGRLLIYEDVVAGLTARFLALFGGLYEAGNYLGPVDVGLAVTGLEGGVSFALQDHMVLKHRLHPYDNDKYLRTERFMALTLHDDPRAAARNLVLPLTRVITLERYDPFSASPRV